MIPNSTQPLKIIFLQTSQNLPQPLQLNLHLAAQVSIGNSYDPGRVVLHFGQSLQAATFEFRVGCTVIVVGLAS